MRLSSPSEEIAIAPTSPSPSSPDFLAPLWELMPLIVRAKTAGPARGKSHAQGQISPERPAASAAPDQARNPGLGGRPRSAQGWIARAGVALRAFLRRRPVRDRTVLSLRQR